MQQHGETGLWTAQDRTALRDSGGPRPQGAGAPPEKEHGFYEAARQLPPRLWEALRCVPPRTAAAVTEIRLRSGRCVVLSTARQNLLVDGRGHVWPTEPAADGCGKDSGEADAAQPLCPLCTPHREMDACFQALCGYSVHSWEGCIREGFVPLAGGHRAGMCGTALVENGAVCGLKNITSINIRIARPQLLQCDERLRACLLTGQSVILAGPPASGKTTLLRAAAKVLSGAGQRVALVDERGELAPVQPDGFCGFVPLHCDVLSGYPKSAGMLQALRGLSPDVLICDEIGGMEDVRAAECAANAGVRLLVTLHAADMRQLLRRPQGRALAETGVFDSAVFLCGREKPGVVERVESLAGVV